MWKSFKNQHPQDMTQVIVRDGPNDDQISLGWYCTQDRDEWLDQWEWIAVSDLMKLGSAQ